MKKSLCFFLFLAAALYLMPLFFRPLTGPEEFRTAEIAREMLEQKNFISIKLLGGRFFETPPMACWLTAASFKLFGFNAFALRLIPLLSTLGSALLLFFWCRKGESSFRTALCSSFLLMSGAVTVIAGNAATSDALFGFFLTAVMVFWGVAQKGKSPLASAFFSAGAGIAAGCAFLTAGFYALLLPFLAITLYLVWQKRFKDLLLFPLLILLIAAAVAAPWAIAVNEAEVDFWRQFAIYGELRKFTTFSVVPYWLRVALFAAGLLPGVFPVLTAMTQLRQGAWSELFHADEVRISLCFLFWALFFLLLPVGTPLVTLVPCFAPAAMLGTMVLDRIDGEKAFVKLRNNTSVFAFIFIAVGSLILLSGIFYLLWGTGFIAALPLKYAVWAPFVTTAALGLVVAGTILFIHRKDKLPEPESFFLLGSIAAAVCVGFFPGFTADSRMPEFELLEIASQLSAEKIRHPRLLASPQVAYATAWCFKDSTVQLINSPGELEYGHRYAVACGEKPLMLTFEQITELVKDTKRKEGVLLAVRKDDFKELPAALLTDGKLFSTAGALSALYYPGKEDKKTEK